MPEKSDKRLPLHQLHRQATRGFPLTPEDQARLAAWYSRQDAREAALLSSEPPTDLADLRRQTEAARIAAQQAEVRCALLAEENKALRQQNDALRQRLQTQGEDCCEALSIVPPLEPTSAT